MSTAVQGVSERRLSLKTTTALREFAASLDVTLNTLLQTAWAILLQRYSQETDVVFGATRACRRSAFSDARRNDRAVHQYAAASREGGTRRVASTSW